MKKLKRALGLMFVAIGVLAATTYSAAMGLGDGNTKIKGADADKTPVRTMLAATASEAGKVLTAPAVVVLQSGAERNPLPIADARVIADKQKAESAPTRTMLAGLTSANPAPHGQFAMTPTHWTGRLVAHAFTT